MNPFSGASHHSPWASEAAFILQLPEGYCGDLPQWPGFVLEALVLGGQVMLDGESWHRGCYGIDTFVGACEVRETAEVYLRAFADFQ
ncbi:hypothetical protein [Haliea sp. E17]|uniref:hypothetical protein n=1 Tax=Haliea sp. E17 TaxID=3401576 RepID=UPI003AAF45DE